MVLTFLKALCIGASGLLKNWEPKITLGAQRVEYQAH